MGKFDRDEPADLDKDIECTSYIGSARALAKIGRFGEAETVLNRAAARFPGDASVAVERVRLAARRKDLPAALERWEDVRRKFPDTVASESANLEIAKLQTDWTAARLAAQRVIELKEQVSGDDWLALAQAHWHLKEADAADEAAQAALARDATLTEALLVRLWVATDRGDGDVALLCYRQLIDLNPDSVRWHIEHVKLLNWLGRIEEAVELLAVIKRRWPHEPAVRQILRQYGPAAVLQDDSTLGPNEPGAAPVPLSPELQELVDRAPAAIKRLRPLLVNDPTGDILTVRPKVPSQMTLLVFTGSNDAVSMPLDLFDAYLAPLPVSGIYLKDFSRLRFLTGIRSLSQTQSGTVLALRSLLGELGAERICTLGNCDGGFAAILYGVELGAERILAFNAPTHSPRGGSLQFEKARNFKRARLAAIGAEDISDLRVFLQDRTHAAQIEFYYEYQDERDVLHARHIEGLPGVRLHPVPGLSNHYLLREIGRSCEDFSVFLADLLRVPGPTP